MKKTTKAAVCPDPGFEELEGPENQAPAEEEGQGAPKVKTWTVDDPELVAVFASMMRRVCRPWPWLSHRIEDLTQDGLSRLVELSAGADGERRRFNSTYLWMTAASLKNEEFHRQARHRPRHSSLRLVDGEELEWNPPDPSPGCDPERSAISSDLRRAVRACLAKLVRSRRRVVLLRMIGYTVSEVARLLRCKYKRAENLSTRGLADLRRCLETQEVL